MNFLITGINGLIGYELVKALLDNPENKIFGIVSSDSIYKHKNLIPIRANLSIKNDISLYLDGIEIDVVIHLAQSSKFREFPNEVLDIWNVNTNKTLELLEFSRKNGVKKFIYASSGGVYGFGKNIFSEEYDIKINNDLGFYLSTKIMSEILTSNYSQFFDTVILRPFFVYGVRQNKNMLIPRLIYKVKNNEPVIINSSGGIKINPIHVSDFIEALILILESNQKGIFNVCGDEIMTIKEICQKISQMVGSEVNFQINEGATFDLLGDNTKIKKLGFKPKISFDIGIKDILSHV